MNMTGFQDTNYGARTNRSYQSTNFSRSSMQMPVKASQTSFSGHATAYLKLGYLYANVDLVNGQELYMNYDESSTEDDPVMLAEGIDIHGNAFQTKIHLNGIDVNHASLIEMTALNVHLAEQGDQAVKDHVSFPLLTFGNRYDITQKMDFEQYFSTITGKYQAAGFDEEASLYKEEMDRYLFFRNTERFRVKTEEEHVLFQSKTEKTGIFSNNTLAELAGYKLDHEIDWESDGTGSLTEKQIQYLKGKYDVEALPEADYYELLAELTEMNVLSGEDVERQFVRRMPPCTAMITPARPLSAYGDRNLDGDESFGGNYLERLKNEFDKTEVLLSMLKAGKCTVSPESSLGAVRIFYEREQEYNKKMADIFQKLQRSASVSEKMQS